MVRVGAYAAQSTHFHNGIADSYGAFENYYDTGNLAVNKAGTCIAQVVPWIKFYNAAEKVVITESPF